MYYTKFFKKNSLYTNFEFSQKFPVKSQIFLYIYLVPNMYEPWKLKKVTGSKFLFRVIPERCVYNVPFWGLSWTTLPTLISDVINGRSLFESGSSLSFLSFSLWDVDAGSTDIIVINICSVPSNSFKGPNCLLLFLLQFQMLMRLRTLASSEATAHSQVGPRTLVSCIGWDFLWLWSFQENCNNIWRARVLSQKRCSHFF